MSRCRPGYAKPAVSEWWRRTARSFGHRAYRSWAKPSGPGLFPGVVLVHYLPGWSEFYIETTRRFAHHGYLAICANLYERAGQGDPDDVAAKVRADGGVPDAQVVGDTDAAVKWMRTQTNHNGKIGVFGSCSGGRHAVIYALPA